MHTGLFRKVFAVEKLSILDRIEYGCVAAMIGLLLGAAIAIAVFLSTGSANWYTIIFSAVFLFLLGCFRGKRAGDFLGRALGSLSTHPDAPKVDILDAASLLTYILAEVFLTRLS